MEGVTQRNEEEKKLLRNFPADPTYLLQVGEGLAFIQDLGDVPGSHVGDLVVV